MMRILRLLLMLLALPALAWSQAQSINGNRVHAGWVNYGATGGTATAYTLTFSPAMPGYVAGQCFLFKPHLTNTGAATLNVQGLGAKALTKLSGGGLVPLIAGDLLLNRLMHACYDGTDLQLMGTAPDASVGVTDGDKQDITVSSSGTVWVLDPDTVTYAKMQNITAASRLLGRGSAAGAGDPQEITLGANCTMTGVELNCTGGAGGGDVSVSGTPVAGQVAEWVTTSMIQGVATTGAGPYVRASSPALITPTIASFVNAVHTHTTATGGGQLTDAALGAPVGVAKGGTNLTTAPDDIVMIGNGTTWQAKPLPECPDTGSQHLNYTTATNTLTCGTSGGTSAFNALTSGTNTTAAMVIGSGASLVATGTGSIAATTVSDNSITLAKLADIPTATLVGRDDPGTGDPEVLTGTQAKTLLGLEQVTNRSDADMFVLAKKLENTRLKARVLNQENVSPITIDANSYDVVKIAELSQDTTFNPPTGTPDVEDALLIEVCTTARRTLTFSTAANGFIAGHGLALPTTNDPGTCFKHLFVWNGSKWSFNSSTQTTTRGVALQVWTSGGPLAEPGWTTDPLATLTASKLAGRGSAGGTGPAQEITLGTNLSMSGTTLNATGSGGVGERFLPVTAVGFPSSGAARVEFSGNSHKLLFDNAAQWCAFWGPFHMNPDYGNTPVLKITYSMFSANTLAVTMRVRVMAITPGTDAHDPDNDANYDAVNTCPASTVPGTAGVPITISCPLTSNDGLLARDLTKVELCRNTGGAAGMMEALAVSLEYVR